MLRYGVKFFLVKATKFLFFLFLLLIPTQLGRHFWPEWSYVLGIRVDYLSPTLYLVDIIWILLFLVEILKIKIPQFKQIGIFSLKKKESLLSFKNLLIVGFVGVNVLVAVNPWVAIYKWVRVFQVLITIFYFRKNKKLVKINLIKVIPCWVIFESLLAMAQIANNGSLNGVFYWLGERSFSFNTIGIAQISVMGRGLIRAYGTFSHPNSLAGFLLVSLVFWYWIKTTLPYFGKGWFKNVWWWVVLWFGFLGILVSGGRTIWLLTFGVILALSLLITKNKANFFSLIFLLLGILSFVLALVNLEYPLSNFLGGWDVAGVTKRMQLNVAAIKMIKESPWFGCGLGNFLVKLPEFQKNSGVYWLQPVHNILILVWSEVGLLGLFFVFLFFNKVINWKKMNFVFKAILVVVLISGMVDHYWLTLPQNIWLLAIVVGLF
jgi:O-antigen ligase